jgi:hypothetical protein
MNTKSAIIVGGAWCVVLFFLVGTKYVDGSCAPILDTELSHDWCQPNSCIQRSLTGIAGGCQPRCRVTVSGSRWTSNCLPYTGASAELIKQCAGGPIEHPVSNFNCSGGGGTGSFSGVTVDCTCCTPTGDPPACTASLQIWWQVCASTGTCTSGSGGIANFVSYLCTVPCP